MMGRLVLLALGVAVGVTAGVFISALATRAIARDGDVP
jgi:hypothetical protein